MLKVILILLLLLVIAYLVALYSEKVEDENKNYVPDEAEEVYFSFKKYISEVKTAFKQLVKIVLRKNAE